MRPVTRKEWIEALKSGKYKQGKLVLHDADDNFCCLGVAMELAGFDKKLDSFSVDEGEVDTYYYHVEGEYDLVHMADFPHESFQRELEISRKIEWEGFERSQANILANLNDSGYTFEQIADLLIFDTWARGLT
jgi:hypothetical protein